MSSQLEIRTFGRADIPEALALCAQVNWNHLAADWERCLALNPEACLGGFEGGVLRATCTLTPFGAVGWVGTFLVDQALRGQGCGKAIFEAMLQVARRQGLERLGLDSSDAGRPIYLKYGVQMTTEGVELWTGPAGGGDGDSPGVARPLADTDWEALLAFDRASVQVARERQLRLLAAEPGVTARVIVEDGSPCAFGFSRPGRLTGSIGPVVARDSRSAIRIVRALMADRRKLDGEKAVGLAILDRPELRAWLQENGFQMRRRNIRMFLPAPVPVLSGPQAFVATGLGMG
jgi:GNAT superfamily N-acetyltransferase